MRKYLFSALLVGVFVLSAVVSSKYSNGIRNSEQLAGLAALVVGYFVSKGLRKARA